ncbi:hypothetical protein D9M69_633840 [compost metagenome]
MPVFRHRKLCHKPVQPLPEYIVLNAAGVKVNDPVGEHQPEAEAGFVFTVHAPEKMAEKKTVFVF